MTRALPLLGLGLLFLNACNSPRVPGASDSLPRFENVVSSAGLGAFEHETGAYGERLFPETMGSGGAFFDYDGDGWTDILLLGGGSWPRHGEAVQAIYLYRNNGDGTFSDVSRETGLSVIQAYGFGVAVADVDADGDRDFFVTTVYENLLFRNDPASDGDGRVFVEIGAAAGVAGGSIWSTSAAFFDADADGYPDLYVANYVPWTPDTDKFCSVDGTTKSYCTPLAYDGIPGRYYRNNGDGTFTDRTESAGFAGSPGKSLGVLPVDFDRDGWTDLLVSNDALRDLLYHNNGDGTFSEIALIAGVAFDERGRARAGMGVDAGVVDETGAVSLFVGNFSNETLGVYRYTTRGTFEERASATQLARPSIPTLTFGLVVLDANLDGRLDIFTANGHVQDDIEDGGSGFTYRQAPHLFINRGDGTFEDAVPSMSGPFSEPVVARAAATADFDRNGSPDLLVTLNGGPAQLWRNDASGFRYLQVDALLESGADALGATIELYTAAGVQYRYVRTAHSYLAASEPTVTFALPTDAVVDSLVITWPGGARSRHLNLEDGQRISIRRGDTD